MDDRNSVASQRVKVRDNTKKLLSSLKKLIVFSGIAIMNKIARPIHRSWGEVVRTHQRARQKTKSWARGCRERAAAAKKKIDDQRSQIKETTSSSLLKGAVTVLRGSEKGLRFCRRGPSAIDKAFAKFQGTLSRYRRDLVKVRRANRMKVRSR